MHVTTIRCSIPLRSRACGLAATGPDREPRWKYCQEHPVREPHGVQYCTSTIAVCSLAIMQDSASAQGHFTIATYCKQKMMLAALNNSAEVLG